MVHRALLVVLIVLVGCSRATLPYKPEPQPQGARISAGYQIVGDRIRIEINTGGRPLEQVWILKPDGSSLGPQDVEAPAVASNPGPSVRFGTAGGVSGHRSAVATGAGVSFPFGGGSSRAESNTIAWFPLRTAGPPPWQLYVKLIGIVPTTFTLYPEYKSTRLRAPAQPPVRVAPSPLEAAGPTFPKSFVNDSEADLTTWGTSAPLGEKMVLVGRVLDDAGRPVRRSLVEVWQANASGKYPHPVDDHDAPMDPNFLGKGQVLTDDEGRYRVVTIKPGAYPWQNHAFAWRPAHIHLSLFGNAYAQRLITQMFFPGDPLLAIDPIFNSVPEAGRRPATEIASR